MDTQNFHYANNVSATCGVADFRITFANKLSNANGEDSVMHDVNHIMMSPQTAKQMSILLSDIVKHYEENIATIVITGKTQVQSNG